MNVEGSRPRLHPALTAAVLAGTLVLVSASSSAASWRASGPPLTASVSTGQIPVAPNFACASKSPLINSYVTLSWDAAALGSNPGSVTYEVWVRDADKSTRTQVPRANPAARAEDLSASLDDLFGGLRDLLLGGQPIYAEVVTVHSSGWRSAPTPGKAIVRTGLLPGVLGGLKCQ